MKYVNIKPIWYIVEWVNHRKPDFKLWKYVPIQSPRSVHCMTDRKRKEQIFQISSKKGYLWCAKQYLKETKNNNNNLTSLKKFNTFFSIFLFFSIANKTLVLEYKDWMMFRVLLDNHVIYYTLIPLFYHTELIWHHLSNIWSVLFFKIINSMVNG